MLDRMDGYCPVECPATGRRWLHDHRDQRNGTRTPDIPSDHRPWTANQSESCAYHRRAIELLKEFRTRLIADVVTGKLDVRGYNVVEESDTTPQGG